MNSSNVTRRSIRNAIDALEPRRLMATFAVTNTADSGTGSLRWAIDQANATPAADVVTFAIGSGAATINLLSPIDVTRPVTIDATTQPGYASAPLVRLNDGGTTAAALLVGPNGTGTVIRGLSVTGFGNPASSVDGNAITLAATTTIEKCYIGLTPSGAAAGNEGDGVVVTSTAANSVFKDNVISSNGGDGVQVAADYVNFVGNFIGTDPGGVFGRGNAGNGINAQDGYDLQLWGQNGLNVISANGAAGVLLKGPNGAGGARIFGNYFGLTKTGNAVLANGTYGIVMDGSSSNLIGNDAAGYGNRFGGSGVRVLNSTFSSKFRNNVFGIGVNPALDVGGSIAMNLESGGNEVTGNTIGRIETGIRLASSQNIVQSNFIGITEAGVSIPVQMGITIAGNWNEAEYNTISNCSLYGTWVISGNNNAIHNLAWNNAQSVWVSDGANSDLPVPTVQSAVEKSNGSIDVNVGAVFSTAGTYRFSFYSSDSAGHPTSGDTRRFIGSTDRPMPAGGSGFTVNWAAEDLLDGQYVTVAVMKTKLGGFNGETGQPSAALKVVSSPAVYETTYLRSLGNAIDVRFSADVSASLNASDLVVADAYNGTLYGATSVTWTAATKTARFIRNGGWPDSRYTASIKTASVAANGKWNIGNFPTDFRVLRGDANDDGRVNFDDLLVLASNYNTTGMSFSQGNFNYDASGRVNFDDLLILAANYNRTIALGAPAPLSLGGNGGGNNDDSAGDDVLA
jgi:hypothetical protein